MSAGLDSGFWLRGLGGAGNFEIAGDVDAGLKTFGVLGGFDYQPTSMLTVGLFAGYTESELDQDTPSSDTEVASWRIGGYGRWQASAVHLDAVVSYGGDRFEIQRRLAIGPLDRVARGDFDGDTYSAYLETGYIHRWANPTLPSVQPYVALHWTDQTHDPYTEAGAGALNLIVPEETADSLRSVTGLRLYYTHASSRTGTISAEVHGAWAHEFVDGGVASARLAGDLTGTVFQVRGIDNPRDSALVGAGVALQRNRHWRVFANFDAELNSAQETFGVSAGVRHSW